ncbi:MAG: methyltransferase domain-containing protein [Candidatus Cloacimonetes bacterium]|nr:methyltransferase domain-containing protein [Candidatus Cloacimonadota bacterium]
MAIPILKNWKNYFTNRDEGLGSSYERVILNKKLESICKHFQIKSILEAPAFGFTGISGINSMDLARKGHSISLIDHDKERIELINKIWEKMNLDINTHFSQDYRKLPFPDKNFDLSWNFSALWFVKELPVFLKELTRITSKAIFLCVPNRSGIGYLSQKILGKKELQKLLIERNIIPKNFKNMMKDLGWMLIDKNYIDCPPWPDIGMPKDKFLKIFKLDWLLKNKTHEPVSIIDYYSGKNENFEEQMLSYSWFEKNKPDFIKYFWAHHRYFLFIPKT